MPEELKPCPFCGGPAELIENKIKEWEIGCKDWCDVGPSVWGYKREEAIEIWNTRATDRKE